MDGKAEDVGETSVIRGAGESPRTAMGSARDSQPSDPTSPVSNDPRFSRRFSVEVAGTLAVRLLITASSVVAGIIVARWLGAEALGELAVINVVVATVVQLSSAGLPSANTYFISRDKRNLASAAINSLIFAPIIGGLLALGVVGLAAWRPQIFSSIPTGLIGVAAISIPFQLLTLIGLNIFLAVGQVERFNLLDLAGQVLILVNAILALVVLKRDLWMLVSLNTAASIAVALVLAFLITRFVARRQERANWRPDAGLFTSMMRYGLKFHISILAGMLIFRADLLVVNHFRGATEAGVYSVASQVSMLLMLVPGVIATLLFPRITAAQDVHGETTCIVTRHTAFLMFFICLAAVPLSFILPQLYGAGFSDVTVQLLILLPGVFLIGIESVLVQHFSAMGLPRAIPMFWLITLFVNLVLVFTLTPPFGARGAAAASTVSYILLFTLVAFYFRSQTHINISDALLLRPQELRQLLAIARPRRA